MSFYCAPILYIQDSKDIISYKNTKSVLTKIKKTVYNNFKSKRLLNVTVDL